MLTAERINDAVEEYGDMLYRLCIVMLRNTADAEDAVQDTFITYMEKSPAFNDSEHEKAWLLKVASNKCRNVLRYRKRHFAEPAEVLDAIAERTPDNRILESLMELPEKYRSIMHLHYIIGYKVEEIADITGLKSSTVKMRLQKGRKLLAEEYGKE